MKWGSNVFHTENTLLTVCIHFLIGAANLWRQNILVTYLVNNYLLMYGKVYYPHQTPDEDN